MQRDCDSNGPAQNGQTFPRSVRQNFRKDWRQNLRNPHTRILTRLFENRQLGDYDVTDSIDREMARRDVDDARRIVEACATYLEERS
jgi:hypothetical protein